ncbi:MAG: phosphotransferase [bacterium]|nr:phosphotransferase [bacterium]
MPLLNRLTRLQIDELIKKHYDLGSVISVRKLKNGWTNTLFKIKTTHGEFFLKVYEEADTMQIMAEHEVVNFLVKAKFPTASIIKTRKRVGTCVFDEKNITLFVAVEGEPLSVSPFKTVLSYRIVSILNLLHNTGTGEFMYLRKLDLAALIEESLGWYLDDHRVEHLRDEIIKLYEGFSSVSFFNLTKCLVHNDLGSDNFLIESNNIKALIDFDQVAYGCIVNDLAKFIARSVNFNVYDVREFTTDVTRFIGDYSKKSNISKDDLHVLVPLIIFQKVLMLVKVKQNIRQGSVRAHIYHFEEYAKLLELELAILFKNQELIKNEFNRLLY